MQTIKAWLRNVGYALIAVIVLFEEWGWEPLSQLIARLARLRLWAWIERGIRQLPPWAALLLFAAPMLALLPVKLAALYLFANGKPATGVTLLLAAKLLGTALLARLFQLTQPALMQLRWFARWYPRWKAWKDRLIAGVRRSPPWLAARRLKDEARARWTSFWSAM